MIIEKKERERKNDLAVLFRIIYDCLRPPAGRKGVTLPD